MPVSRVPPAREDEGVVGGEDEAEEEEFVAGGDAPEGVVVGEGAARVGRPLVGSRVALLMMGLEILPEPRMALALVMVPPERSAASPERMMRPLLVKGRGMLRLAAVVMVPLLVRGAAKTHGAGRGRRRCR